VPHGIIEGVYGPFRIGNDLMIRCEVGFLRGAIVRDGLRFRVEFEDEAERLTLGKQDASYDGQQDEFMIDLAGITEKIGYIILHLDASDSPGKDWAIWNVAKIVQK
jgi:hypothetical protein